MQALSTIQSGTDGTAGRDDGTDSWRRKVCRTYRNKNREEQKDI